MSDLGVVVLRLADIDLTLVGPSVAWILGLALVFASFSFASYRSSEQGTKIWAVLALGWCRFGIEGGLALFTLGFALGTSSLWERLGWGLLALIFVNRLLPSSGRIRQLIIRKLKGLASLRAHLKTSLRFQRSADQDGSK